MADEEQPKKSKATLLVFVFLLLNLLVMSGGFYLIYSSTIGAKSTSVSEEDLNKDLIAFRKELQDKPAMYQMEKFQTNLDGVPRRVIRIEVNLEMLNEEGFEEIFGLKIESRDAIVDILSEKKYKDLESVQGKLHLKNQIIARLNSFLHVGVVKDVYFTDFIIQ